MKMSIENLLGMIGSSQIFDQSKHHADAYEEDSNAKSWKAKLFGDI